MFVKLTKEAEQDLDLLDDNLYDEAYKYLKLFEVSYEKYSLPLFNMNGRNLKGCRKTYFGNSEYRIVSKLENDIVSIVSIISIGKRDNMDVYKKAHLRIHETN